MAVSKDLEILETAYTVNLHFLLSSIEGEARPTTSFNYSVGECEQVAFLVLEIGLVAIASFIAIQTGPSAPLDPKL